MDVISESTSGLSILMHGFTSLQGMTLINTFFSSGVKGLNSKDQMYNKLIDKFQQDGLDFPKDSVKTEGAYFVQVLSFKVGFREMLLQNEFLMLFNNSYVSSSMNPRQFISLNFNTQ